MENFGIKSLLVLVIICLWVHPGVESTFAPPRYPGGMFPGSTPPFNPNARPYPIPFPQPKYGGPILIARNRRSPQGSVEGSVSAQEGSRPSLNIDYKQTLIDNGKSQLDAYGGVSSSDFKHFQPHAGATYEYTPNKDFFIRGEGSVQQMPGGRFDPQVGVGMGWRF